MHKEKIIGHIVENICVGEDLKPIADETEEIDLPSKMHIVTGSVIYKVWENPVTQAEVDKIIDEVSKGGWAVSMECTFRDFSYALMNSKGEQRLIHRTSATNYLTKYLRQYKGPGKLHGYTIGRLLKDITFSGVALVKQPANPDSIISDALNVPLRSNANMGYINLEPKGETNMSKDVVNANLMEGYSSVEEHPLYKNLLDKHDRLMKDHENMKNHVDGMKSKLDNIHEHTMAVEEEEKAKMEKEVCGLKAALAEKEAALAEKDKDYGGKTGELEAVKTAHAALQGENDAMKATLQAYKDAERSHARVEQLLKADKTMSLETAQSTVAKFVNDSDSAFEATVAVIAGYVSRAPKEVTAEKVLDSAKADADIPLGGAVVDAMTARASEVKEWWNSNKKVTSHKGS